MNDKPYRPAGQLAVPLTLYPLHCAWCNKLTGMLVIPKNGEWRVTDCSHCNKRINWRIGEDGVHVIEKSTQREGVVYMTGSPI